MTTQQIEGRNIYE